MWSKKKRKEKRENAKRAAEGKPPLHESQNEKTKGATVSWHEEFLNVGGMEFENCVVEVYHQTFPSDNLL